MLFQYVNGDGEPQPITSGDVNDYIREATGGDFTAKHFRTWGASVIAFDQLLEEGRARADHASRRWSSRSPKRSATPSRSAASPMSTRRCSRRSRSDPRDPLDGMERPRARKWLSSAEVGLLEFLAQAASRRGGASRSTVAGSRQLAAA